MTLMPFVFNILHKGGNDFHNLSLSFSVHEEVRSKSKEDRPQRDMGNKKLHMLAGACGK